MRYLLLIIGILFCFNAQAKEICVEDKACFVVSFAQDEEELAKGLMFVRSLPDNEGMLFDLRTHDKVVMWMKNTYIPLDMLFMDCQGYIVDIYEKAKPLSLTYITPNSDEKVCYVLEINGGQVLAHQMRIGDVIKGI